MSVVLPSAVFWIEPEEPIIGRTDPDESGPILDDAGYVERNAGLYAHKRSAFSRRIDAV